MTIEAYKSSTLQPHITDIYNEFRAGKNLHPIAYTPLIGTGVLVGASAACAAFVLYAFFAKSTLFPVWTQITAAFIGVSASILFILGGYLTYHLSIRKKRALQDNYAKIQVIHVVPIEVLKEAVRRQWVIVEKSAWDHLAQEEPLDKVSSEMESLVQIDTTDALNMRLGEKERKFQVAVYKSRVRRSGVGPATIKSLSSFSTSTGRRVPISYFVLELQHAARDCKGFLRFTVITALACALITTLGALSYYGILIDSSLAVGFLSSGGGLAGASLIFFICLSVKGFSLYQMHNKDLRKDPSHFKELMQDALDWQRAQWDMHNQAFKLDPDYKKDEAELRFFDGKLRELITSHRLNMD